MLIFALGVSILTGILFRRFGPGAEKYLQLRPVRGVLKEGGRGISGERHRALGIFTVAEVALALVLLVGAGLMIRSLAHLWSVDPGFDPHHLLTFNIRLSPANASNPSKVRAAFRELNDQLSALPGVQAATLELGALPFSGSNTMGYWAENEPKPAKAGDAHITIAYAVGSDYFRVMGIPLLRGRPLTQQDNESAPLVIVVDEYLARSLFAGPGSIQETGPSRRVEADRDGRRNSVGVAGHVKQFGPRTKDTDSRRSTRSFTCLTPQGLDDQCNDANSRCLLHTSRALASVSPSVLLASIRKESKPSSAVDMQSGTLQRPDDGRHHRGLDCGPAIFHVLC